MRSIWIATAGLLGSPAVAQDLPPVAGQTVEITVTGEGEAQQEPQGYQLTAMFFSYRDDGVAGYRAAREAIEEVEEWDLPFRTTCLNSSRVGFVGNGGEEAGDVTFILDGEAGSEDRSTAGDQFAPPTEPLYFMGQFADEESLARATSRLRSASVQIVSTMAVAFDCSEAEHAARTRALADAYAQARMLADELGMRIVGMTSADFSSGEGQEWLLGAMLGVGRDDEALVAHAVADVAFTFERRLAN